MNKQLTIERPKIEGKFLTVGDEKIYIKGVTYGTFKPNDSGDHFPPKEVVHKDFAQMAAFGFNTLRTYTVPPTYLLDAALANGLRVMVGLPWEQHIAFLDSKKRVNDIVRKVQEYVTSCSNHPAILCYTIGNEIPAPIVRWYGSGRVENFLYRLYTAVKFTDPHCLVTYVNYPTTEYLRLPFLDFDCFNVYLESEDNLSAYLQRLHNLTGDRPLVLAEVGLDSMRNGVEKQAEVLDWQIRTIFAKGCAGTFVFAWTDEWWRGGSDIEDWDFGLVDRQRNPKPALFAVSKALSEAPFPKGTQEPLISVVVCSYNGAPTIRDCMEGLQKLDYDNYEVIVIDDGSTDHMAQIVGEYPVRLIRTPNRGLSNARNRGMIEARGEIVAYLDDDAYPDPQWLKYLAHAYQTSNHASIGGPNIPPDDDGPIATCVANAPGGPVHVLMTDEIAEHIPGCNMTFRKEALEEIGGFDPVFRAAGDDVDVCWRLQQNGKTIGFHPSAVVWHHRRNSLKAYWRQQKGYGKAEALLEAKWPERYNGFGHLSWAGKIYGNGVTQPIKLKRDRIFHGVWGAAPFQSLYQRSQGVLTSIPLMPEWYVLIVILTFLSTLGISWSPLRWLLPFLLVAQAIVFVQAGLSASRSLSSRYFPERVRYLKFWGLTTLMHAIQPIARLYGRIAHGLTPWRTRGSDQYGWDLLFRQTLSLTHWSEEWKGQDEWLGKIEANLIEARTRVRRGGHWDRWDLEVFCGFFSSARGILTIEEHGGGKQLLRFKCQSKYSRAGIGSAIVFGILSALSLTDSSYFAAGILGIVAVSLGRANVIDKAKALYELAGSFSSLSAVETGVVLEEKDVSEEGIGDEPVLDGFGSRATVLLRARDHGFAAGESLKSEATRA